MLRFIREYFIKLRWSRGFVIRALDVYLVSQMGTDYKSAPARLIVVLLLTAIAHIISR